MREKADILQKGDKNLFGKKFRLHIVETEQEIYRSGNL